MLHNVRFGIDSDVSQDGWHYFLANTAEEVDDQVAMMTIEKMGQGTGRFLPYPFRLTIFCCLQQHLKDFFVVGSACTVDQVMQLTQNGTSYEAFAILGEHFQVFKSCFPVVYDEALHDALPVPDDRDPAVMRGL